MLHTLIVKSYNMTISLYSPHIYQICILGLNETHSYIRDLLRINDFDVYSNIYVYMLTFFTVVPVEPGSAGCHLELSTIQSY